MRKHYQIMSNSNIRSFGFQCLLHIVLFSCCLFILISPIILQVCNTHDWSFLCTSVLFALPLCALIISCKTKWILYVILAFLSICSLTEIVMVAMYGQFIIAGNIVATLTTTAEESASFAQNALHVLWYFIPVIGVYGLIIFLLSLQKINRKISLGILGVSCLLVIGFVGYKQVVFYNSTLTLRYYVDNRIWNRPPYNIFYQIHNVIEGQRVRKNIENAQYCNFGSTKQTTQQKEVYILGIGESMRYENLSLNGQYSRSTTPKLESIDNIILYNNYYSTACLTMYSVPQILTRATPQEYVLNYKEKSIFKPFQEVGFKTFCIVCKNLLTYETYLTNGVDSLICVERDKDIPETIDSLISIYPKTFFIVQFLGNHSFYYNYEPEFDVYKPNVNNTPNDKSFNAYLNAYDNTVLYADYILSEIISKINQPNTLSGFLFVSDHGEILSEDTLDGGKYGHGGNCNPNKVEYHVPLITWYSNTYANTYPNKVQNVRKYINRPINADNVFYSVCDMADINISSQYAKPEWSIFGDSLVNHTRYILVPDGINYIEVK